LDSAFRTVKSAARTVELLECLSRTNGRMTLSQLQAELGYPKSSIYVLARTLVEHGWLETDPTGSLYGLGLRALLVGTSYIDGDETVALARDTLRWLAAEVNETVHLARLDGADVVYLATQESKHDLRPFTRVGRRLPAHATSLGKSLLAERSDAQLAALLPDALTALTDRTLADPAALRADLEGTRARGYAIDREENTIGVCCYGVALRLQAPATDALSCSVPLARLNPEREHGIVTALLEARHRIEKLTRQLRRNPGG
jgi:IclR family transcriptional regulator, acetate operon repressor